MEKSYIGGGGFWKKLQFKFKLNIYISIVNFTVQATDKNGPASNESRLLGIQPIRFKHCKSSRRKYP